MTVIEAWEKTLSLTSLGIIQEIREYLTTTSQEIPDYLSVQLAVSADNYYYFMWSGDKTISPYVEKLMSLDENGWKRAIAVQFWNMHKQQLDRQWANFAAQYEPVNNYHVTEVVDYDHTGGNEYTDSGSDTKTRSGVIQNYGKIKSTNKAWTYDNQSQNVSENETLSADTDNPSTTRYGTGHDDGLVDETEYGKTRTGSESGHDDLTTTKSGNLGITPIAQLLQMDIELWKLNFFTSVFFPLLDKAIALPIY